MKGLSRWPLQKSFNKRSLQRLWPPVLEADLVPLTQYVHYFQFYSLSAFPLYFLVAFACFLFGCLYVIVFIFALAPSFSSIVTRIH